MGEKRDTKHAAGSDADCSVMLFDARGNGGGWISPTITGDHENRITDYTAVVLWKGTEMKAFNQISQSAGYSEAEVSVSITVCGGSYGGGSEVLVADEVTGMKDNPGRIFGMSGYGGFSERVAPLRASGGDYGNGSENLTITDISEFGGSSAVDCRNGMENAEVNGAIQAGQQRSLNCNNVCRTGNVVRRLTPLECERLQGYPDGWTDIGVWTDSKGKKHKDADAPRYKALGNSIALPFWFWLLRRISAQYERPATLGSLFDGIGGFPLCWERCNGKGTAIWASEIEEFPIAVTKKHFPEEEE